MHNLIFDNDKASASELKYEAQTDGAVYQRINQNCARIMRGKQFEGYI